LNCGVAAHPGAAQQQGDEAFKRPAQSGLSPVPGTQPPPGAAHDAAVASPRGQAQSAPAAARSSYVAVHDPVRLSAHVVFVKPVTVGCMLPVHGDDGACAAAQRRRESGAAARAI
jgi:hypothetical protein